MQATYLTLKQFKKNIRYSWLKKVLMKISKVKKDTLDAA